jgi:hypothetical protein
MNLELFPLDRDSVLGVLTAFYAHSDLVLPTRYLVPGSSDSSNP